MGALQVPRHTYSADSIRGTRELLTTQSVAWITTFAETGGIEQILHGLENLSNKKNKSEEDYTAILEYLSCITIMIGIGLESLLISNAVEIVVLNIDSDNAAVKEATVYVLDEVCNVFYSGQGLVIDALTKMCKDESKRFLPLYAPLTAPNVSMAMKAASMKLINNLITNTDDLEARCVLRNSFISLGLHDTLEQLRASTGEEYQRLEQQIDHFEEVMNDDGEEIALRFKEGQVDIKNLPMFNALRQTPLRGSSSTNIMAPTLRVVLPSVSHTHMSCMIAQHPCDPNTSALDVVRSLIKDNSKMIGLEGDGMDRVSEFGLWQMAYSMKDPPEGDEEKVDPMAGWFLEGEHKVQPLALEGVILDLRLRPWRVSIAVDKSVYDLMVHAPKAQSPGGVKPLPTVPETQMEVEPKTTCGSLMLQVLRKLFGDKSYETEDLAFFMQQEKKVPDRTNKATAGGGIWLESTAKLSDYGSDVTKTKLQLKKTPKTLKIILTDDSFEYVAYDEDTLVRVILQDTFQRIVAPSMGQTRQNSPSHYGLFHLNEETNAGDWLDPEKSLRSYDLPNRVPLRYLLKPKHLNVSFVPPESFKGELPKIENPILAHFYVPIADVLSKLNISLEGCGVYLVSDSGDQYLDANLSLFNQNVPENSTVVVRAATKKDAQVAASVHIWEEPENASTIMYNVENFNEIHAATVNKLVERLTSEKDHDSDFTQIFEATYRTFMTHEALFAKLVERYIPPENIVHPALNVVRLRVIVFLKNWLDHSSNDIPQGVMLNIEKFIDNQLCKGGHMNLAAQLKKMIQVWKAHNTGDTVREAPDLNYQMSNPTKIIHGFSSLVDEWGLALQMTIRESKLFSQIKPVEFFNNKANDPIVAQMINNFNRVAAWVPIAILSEIKLVHRANAVERFIKLAWNLRQLNNFHLLTAVLSGLSNSAVLRLKWTFAKVAKRYKQMLEELESVMAMEGSFKNYRNTLVAATPPCVPYVGVYLTDLVFIEDGNPDKIGNMVNWTKRKLMYNIISTFQRYQLAQYDEKQQSPTSPTHAGPGSPLNENKEANINTFLTFLNRMPILSDKQLYDMSMAREPRNCERRELM